MRQIDITGKKFDFVDYSEGNIFFDTFSEKETFVIKVWGVTLMQELEMTEQDVYIAAISDLVFEDVIYISIKYWIYANKEGSKFIRNKEGGDEFQLKLGKKEVLNGYTEYMIGGILGKYVGYGEFTVYCKGKITLIYDEKAAISATEFCLNTQKYRFN